MSYTIVFYSRTVSQDQFSHQTGAGSSNPLFPPGMVDNTVQSTFMSADFMQGYAAPSRSAVALHQPFVQQSNVAFGQVTNVNQIGIMPNFNNVFQGQYDSSGPVSQQHQQQNQHLHQCTSAQAIAMDQAQASIANTEDDIVLQVSQKSHF